MPRSMAALGCLAVDRAGIVLPGLGEQGRTIMPDGIGCGNKGTVLTIIGLAFPDPGENLTHERCGVGPVLNQRDDHLIGRCSRETANGPARS